MEGAGLGAGLGLLVAGLLEWWQLHSVSWARLGPLEQNLRRASKGAAFVLLPLIASFWLYGARGYWDFFHWLAHDPAAAWPGFVLAGALACGLFRCIVGVWRMRGFVGDSLLASASFFKLLGGGGGAWLLSTNAVAGIAAPQFWSACLWVAAMGYALNWAVVGAMRCVLTLGIIGGASAWRIVYRQSNLRNAPLVAAGSRNGRPVLLFLAALAMIGGGAFCLFW
jgi:hypothetical protein